MMNEQQWKSDRRLFPRRDSGSEVALVKQNLEHPANEQQQEWALFSTQFRGPLIDISMNGVSFLVDEDLQVGESVCLRLSNPKFDSMLDIKAQVIRTTKMDGSRWKVVCQFNQNLGFEEITQFAHNTVPSCLV